MIQFLEVVLDGLLEVVASERVNDADDVRLVVVREVDAVEQVGFKPCTLFHVGDDFWFHEDLSQQQRVVDDTCSSKEVSVCSDDVLEISSIIEVLLVECNSPDVLSPVVVLQCCLHVVRDMIRKGLVGCEVLSSMLRALQVEPDSNFEVFEDVVHNHEVSLILLLSSVFPHDLV